jgi:transposase
MRLKCLDFWGSLRVKHYEKEGLKGLEEKRGRSRGNGRQRKNPSLNEELVRLKAENEYLKKLLALRKE